MSEDWDELFANAAGQHSSTSTSTAVSPQSNERKRKRKEKRAVTKRQDGDQEFSRMLADRMTVPSLCESAWPRWLRLCSLHISKSKCPGWEDKIGKQGKLRSCRHCTKSPLHHRVQVKVPHGKNIVAQSIFGNTRNIRCCASILVESSDEEAQLLAQAIQSEATRMKEALQSLLSTLPSGEGSLLAAKCTLLFESSSRLISRGVCNTKKERIGAREARFEDTIRLIIACDAVYYRLYYLQITRVLPVHVSCIFLPHPSQYFLLPYLSWDTPKGEENLNEYLQSLASNVKESGAHKSVLSAALQRYGVDESQRQATSRDPLRAVHRNRFIETVTVFYSSGRMRSEKFRAETSEALEGVKRPADDNLGSHETPAPALLMEWRDSCRDFLCNLYAYATLAPGTEVRIQSLLDTYDIKDGLIELGAGTGFLARVLHDQGIHITAWDVLPSQDTSALNEYHGCTPPFFAVQKGDVGALKSRVNLSTKSALLLCYPPPRSSMARDALKAYMDRGGRFLLHIGEFVGLTGSAEFESLLTNNFECLDRMPCLAWGTDAADVTLWMRVNHSNTSNPPSRLLLPCCQCRRRASAKRCRLGRNLVYCGTECCLQHEPARRIHLSLNMIAIDESKLNFENQNHYANLRHVSNVGIVSHSKNKHRKRKTK